MLFELLDHVFQVGIAGAKPPGDPVASPFRDLLAVGDHLELAGPAVRYRSVSAQPILDQGHETRDLSLIVLSRRAGDDLDFHGALPGLDPSSSYIIFYA